MGYGNFYDLDVWKRARQFRHLVMDCIKQFPNDEKFELSSQLRRAVRSIQANIAEGHGRQTFKDEQRFLTMARGSHTECMNHLIEAFDSGYLSADQMRFLKYEWDATGMVINGYLRFIQSRIDLQSGGKSADTVEESEMPYQIEKDDSVENDSFDELLDDSKS